MSAGQSSNHDMQSRMPPVSFVSRSAGPLVVTFPVVLGSAVSIVAMVIGEVAAVAVLLGWGDLGDDASGRGLALTFAAVTACVAAGAVGLGAMVSARLLLLRDVAVGTARWVALAQSGLVVGLLAVHGLVTAAPAVPAVVLFGVGGIVGAIGGAWFGVPVRWREGER